VVLADAHPELEGVPSDAPEVACCS
jgi:hypothetical protein